LVSTAKTIQIIIIICNIALPNRLVLYTYRSISIYRYKKGMVYGYVIVLKLHTDDLVL